MLQKCSEMLQKPGSIILDVRNGYESNIGHFLSPVNPTYLLGTRKFSDTVLEEIPKKPVMAYCTGGVRCEALSRSYEGQLARSGATRLQRHHKYTMSESK